MVSVKTKFINLGEVPFKAREWRKEGFVHFAFELSRDEPIMTTLRAWRDQKETEKKLKCLKCEQTFRNKINLLVHQETAGHER